MLTTVSPVALVIAILAVWRITHLFWGEDGPWDVFVRFRRMAGEGFLGSLLDCFYCLSLWISAPLAWRLGNTWLERLLLWMSLSGGAILLERISAGPTERANMAGYPAAPPLPSPPAVWREEPPSGPAKQG